MQVLSRVHAALCRCADQNVKTDAALHVESVAAAAFCEAPVAGGGPEQARANALSAVNDTPWKQPNPSKPPVKTKFNPFKQVRACADGCVCVKFVSTCMSAFVSTYMFEAYFTDDKQGRPSVPNKGLRELKFSSNRGKDDCLDGMTFVITGAKCMCVLQTC